MQFLDIGAEYSDASTGKDLNNGFSSSWHMDLDEASPCAFKQFSPSRIEGFLPSFSSWQLRFIVGH